MAPPSPNEDDSSDSPLSVVDRLMADTFEPDEEPFIVVDTAICGRCDSKPCLYVCPSQVYVWEDGQLLYNPEGCIELGACTIVCDEIGEGAIRWSYPRGGHGVEYKYG